MKNNRMVKNKLIYKYSTVEIYKCAGKVSYSNGEEQFGMIE